jgi:hypothetical protein
MTRPWPDPDPPRSYRRHPRHEVIEGEVVDAPLVLAAGPAVPVRLCCDTHPAWMNCGIDQPACVTYNAPGDDVDDRTWTQRATTFRVVDRRRLSYPRDVSP